MHLRPLLLAVLLLAAGPGCSRITTIEGSPTARPPAGSVAAPIPQRCPPQDGRIIEITAGAITCAQAYATAARYDLQGEKYQHLDAFTCYTGTAQTAPIILVCTSPDTEFSVSRT